jgi:hypothetical protein
MANQQASDFHYGSGPFFDFGGFLTKPSQMSTTMQAFGKEWTDFIGARARENSQFLNTLRECKELSSVQRAYMQFWGKALSQYEEETQRLMRIAQGAMQEAPQVAEESGEVASGRRASKG